MTTTFSTITAPSLVGFSPESTRRAADKKALTRRSTPKQQTKDAASPVAALTVSRWAEYCTRVIAILLSLLGMGASLLVISSCDWFYQTTLTTTTGQVEMMVRLGLFRFSAATSMPMMDSVLGFLESSTISSTDTTTTTCLEYSAESFAFEEDMAWEPTEDSTLTLAQWLGVAAPIAAASGSILLALIPVLCCQRLQNIVLPTILLYLAAAGLQLGSLFVLQTVPICNNDETAPCVWSNDAFLAVGAAAAYVGAVLATLAVYFGCCQQKQRVNNTINSSTTDDKDSVGTFQPVTSHGDDTPNNHDDSDDTPNNNDDSDDLELGEKTMTSEEVPFDEISQEGNQTMYLSVMNTTMEEDEEEEPAMVSTSSDDDDEEDEGPTQEGDETSEDSNNLNDSQNVKEEDNNNGTEEDQGPTVAVAGAVSSTSLWADRAIMNETSSDSNASTLSSAPSANDTTVAAISSSLLQGSFSSDVNTTNSVNAGMMMSDDDQSSIPHETSGEEEEDDDEEQEAAVVPGAQEGDCKEEKDKAPTDDTITDNSVVDGSDEAESSPESPPKNNEDEETITPESGDIQRDSTPNSNNDEETKDAEATPDNRVDEENPDEFFDCSLVDTDANTTTTGDQEETEVEIVSV